MRVGSLAILAVLGVSQAFGISPEGASQFPLGQQPLQAPSQPSQVRIQSDRLSGGNNNMLNWKSDDFEFKKGEDVFTPHDLVELPRPGEGVPNAAGDLVLVSVSTYSFKTDK